MEAAGLTILKLILFIFGSLGIAFHALTLINPEDGRRMEQSLATEFGTKKEFVSWLEAERMGLHERLIRSKAYNIIAIIFLVILFLLLARM